MEIDQAVPGSKLSQELLQAQIEWLSRETSAEPPHDFGALIRQRLRVRLAMAPFGLIPNAGPEGLKILSDGPAFSDVL
jgi:hypothetical protein